LFGLLSEESGEVLLEARSVRVDLSKCVSFVHITHLFNDGLNAQHVWAVSVPPEKSSIDKECQRCSQRRMSGDTRDFVGESGILVHVVLSENSLRIHILELEDLRVDFSALFAAFVFRINDCHLSLRHVHDLGKGCAIWE